MNCIVEVQNILAETRGAFYHQGSVTIMMIVVIIVMKMIAQVSLDSN